MLFSYLSSPCFTSTVLLCLDLYGNLSSVLIFLGSVISAFNAECATVAGEAKNILASLFPILPLKLRFAVEITLYPSAGIPCPVPRHGPHEVDRTFAPAFKNISINPSFRASR